MFRNPRENSIQELTEKLLPSTGRAPTPPSGSTNQKSPRNFGLPRSIAMLSRQDSSGDIDAALRVTSATSKTPSKSRNSRTHGKPQNQSILNFFSKKAGQEDNLFFDEAPGHTSQESPPKKLDHVYGALENSNLDPYNEHEGSVKRRKLVQDREGLLVRTPSPEARSASVRHVDLVASDQKLAPTTIPKVVRHIGGFIDDSSDEEGLAESSVVLPGTNSADGEAIHQSEGGETEGTNGPIAPTDVIEVTQEMPSTRDESSSHGEQRGPSGIDTRLGLRQKVEPNSDLSRIEMPQPVPPLIREATSIFAADEFENMGDFEEDEFFEGGEEMMERRYMEEQRMLELDFDEDSKSESPGDDPLTPIDDSDAVEIGADPANDATCPICSVSLKGTTELEASAHVNSCLDGKPTLLPSQRVPEEQPEGGAHTEPKVMAPSAKRFQRAAIARPGQQNPFSLSKDGKGSNSAFSQLMSGHKEDAAWAEAANNEAQSRGKPAYQRTCPFYKIMPDMYVCVDAFRYGKVAGQNAYFLSHFHSDHYIGLTSSWCHGPIYCSKVTANLVRQQLRVDPKWVMPLEFEKKVELPNTKGVSVTMLPANHCPGSSLYLFEKSSQRGPKGTPKITRILHCGDFRACPAHVNHPLLKPEVIDAVTGQTNQQHIDTCYLDTTYLTPKYAFPSQQDVIDACAQMCVSLSKDIPDSNDKWEKVKLERAGSTMTKFLEKGSSDVALIKEEEEDKKATTRGRLLVVIGTYSIGKERICLGIATALKSKIYAPPVKMRICACLEDKELNSRLTSNPLEAQVHMQTLMEIRAETLHDYLTTYKGHFARVVGFRPTGWNYRPPTSRFTENPAVNTVLNSDGWKSRFTMKDLAPGRGSTRESNCFGVPYSEHSSFRELTMFCCALRIGKIIPTVNVGSAKSRERMKGWIEKWDLEKKKNGLFKVEFGDEGWGSGDGALNYGV